MRIYVVFHKYVLSLCNLFDFVNLFTSSQNLTACVKTIQNVKVSFWYVHIFRHWNDSNWKGGVCVAAGLLKLFARDVFHIVKNLRSSSHLTLINGRTVSRISQQRGKNHKGRSHFLDKILDVCNNRDTKHEMRGHMFQMGAGHHCPPRWRRTWLTVQNIPFWYCIELFKY